MPDHKWQPLIGSFHVGLLTVDEAGDEGVLPWQSAVNANCIKPTDCDSLLPPPGSGHDSPCARPAYCPLLATMEAATNGPEDDFSLFHHEDEGCCGNGWDYSIIVLNNAPTLGFSAAVYNLAGIYPQVTTGSVWSVWTNTKADGSPDLVPWPTRDELMVFVR